MISFDQVLLLQEKVESAVQKIVELKSENDALRSKCSELTNALSEKTELLETLNADEQKIERSIINALDKLNTIENSIANQACLQATNSQDKSESESESESDSKSQQKIENQPEDKPQNQLLENQPSDNQVAENQQESLFNSDDVNEPEFDDDDSTDGKKFDIF